MSFILRTYWKNELKRPVKGSSDSPFFHKILLRSHIRLLRNRTDKIDPRFEIRIERFGPISDLRSEICSPNSGSATRIDLNWTIPDLKSFTKLLVLAWQAYLTKNWLSRNQPDSNHIQPKPKRPEMSLNPNMTRSKLDPNRMTKLSDLLRKNSLFIYPKKYYIICG